MNITKQNPQSEEVPIIDLSAYINDEYNTEKTAKEFRNAMKNIGFFYIKNHGVPLELQREMFQCMQNFFALPKDQKNRIHINKNQKSGTGYFGLGQQYTNGKIDVKQGIYFSQQLEPNHPKVQQNFPLHGNNIFPQNPSNFKQKTLTWMKHMDRIGKILLQGISESLGFSRNYLNQGFYKQHLGLMSMFHYPYDQTRDPNKWAVGQHTDYGLLIILMTSDKGLQVKSKNGNWINVDPIQDTFIINIGDTLQKMTKGLYKSTNHRVRNTQGVSRYSIPVFYDPGWDTQIKQLDFEVSEHQKCIMEANQKQQRPDKSNLKDLKGIYGQYLMKKLSKTLPSLEKYKQYTLI